MLALWGDAPYPTEYSYDSYGRMSTLNTYRGTSADFTQATWPSSPGTADTTTWTYQEATGLLTAKTYADNKSVSYTYTADGKLATRTWARLDGSNPLVTSYSYDTAADLTGIGYSDSTPAVGFTYNRLGQQKTVADVVGTRTFAYNNYLQILSETIDGSSGGLYSKTISRSYAASGVTGRYTGVNIGSEYGVTYGYDTYGRPSSLTNGSDEFTFAYLANSNLLSSVSSPSSTSSMSYESHRNLLTQVSNNYNSTTVSNYNYTNDAIGRRSAAGWSGTAFTQSDTITYGYNDRSEVTSADATSNANYDFGFSYDPIGNRLTSASKETGTTVTRNYTSNQLNQYTAINNPTAAPTYDFDGNMLGDGSWNFTWDAENRLIAAESPAGATRLEFKYDYMSRRVEKKIYSGSTGNWTLTSDLRFVYDGYLQIEELALDIPNSQFVIRNCRVWSPALQGLGSEKYLSETQGGSTYYALGDANKNVTEYLDASGNIKAHYEFSPFGKVVNATGAMSGDFNYRFSSEYLDVETGLVYYNYRYFSTELGRFLSRDSIKEKGGWSRDPMEEKGGNNLYGGCGNNFVNSWDKLGLLPFACYRPLQELDWQGPLALFWHAFIRFSDGSTDSNTGSEGSYTSKYTKCYEGVKDDTKTFIDGRPCCCIKVKEIESCVKKKIRTCNTSGFPFSNNCGTNVSDAFESCCLKNPTPCGLVY